MTRNPFEDYHARRRDLTEALDDLRLAIRGAAPAWLVRIMDRLWSGPAFKPTDRVVYVHAGRMHDQHGVEVKPFTIRPGDSVSMVSGGGSGGPPCDGPLARVSTLTPLYPTPPAPYWVGKAHPVDGSAVLWMKLGHGSCVKKVRLYTRRSSALRAARKLNGVKS